MPKPNHCDGCIYWRWGFDGGNCCHHLLYTGKRRLRDGDKCLSYEPKKKKRKRGVDKLGVN